MQYLWDRRSGLLDFIAHVKLEFDPLLLFERMTQSAYESQYSVDERG